MLKTERSFEDDIYNQFFKKVITFNGKRCLDIGTRNGLNCLTLVKLGASEVIGIDIDDTRFKELDSSNDKITLSKCNLLDFNDEKKFDVITCFLWNIYFNDYDNIIEKIKLLLIPDGILYIGIHDSVYKYDDIVSVPKLLVSKFEITTILDYESSYQWIISARTPGSNNNKSLLTDIEKQNKFNFCNYTVNTVNTLIPTKKYKVDIIYRNCVKLYQCPECKLVSGTAATLHPNDTYYLCHKYNCIHKGKKAVE